MARTRTWFAAMPAVTSGATRMDPVVRNLFGFAGTPRLTVLHDMIASELQSSRRHNLSNLRQLRASAIEHARILEVIHARDETRTARAFGQRVLAGKRRIMETVATDAAD